MGVGFIWGWGRPFRTFPWLPTRHFYVCPHLSANESPMFFPAAAFIRLLATCLILLMLTVDLLAAGDDVQLDTIPPPPTLEQPALKEKESFEWFGGIREEMPLLAGCRDKPDYASRKKCSDSLLIAFIYDNLRYPYQAWRDSVQGFAIISFSVEKDGTVSETRVVRDPGAGTGAEALRLVNLMNESNARWIPGTQAGKPVRVQFNLPVKFKMADNKLPPPPAVEEIFMVTRHVPGFPGCEHLARGHEKRKCGEKMLQRFIHDNLVYPELAKKKKMEGTAVVQFYVERDGTTSPQIILENPGMGMGEEVMRLLNLMNRKGIRWTIGNSYARHHRTLFHLSIEFRLSRNKPFFSPPTLVQILEAPDTYPYVADTISIANSAFRINRIPDIAPVFPGADTSLSNQEQQQYTSDQLRAYFMANFAHQDAGVHLGGKGDFLLNFIVGKDGRISTISVDKDLGGGVAAATVRVMNQMIEEDLRWLPGKRERYDTPVEITIPISLIPKGQEIYTPGKGPTITLQQKQSGRRSLSMPPPPPPPPPSQRKENVQLATMLEEPPLFPGCEDLGTYQKKQECAAAKMEEFIQGNLRYPESAREKGIEGTVLVSYIVEKDGRVSNGKVIYDLGAGTGKEALRLVNLIGEKGLKFSPPKSDGRAPRVMYILPVRFTLE